MGYHDVFRGTSWFVCIVAVVTVSIICNGCMLFIVLRTKCLRTVPNYYISSVSISNILTGIFCGISVVIDSLGLANDTLWCALLPCLDRCCLAAGVFSLVGLCIDRYRFYVKSSTYQSEAQKVLEVLLAVWTTAALYGMTLFAVSQSITKNGMNIKNKSCSKYQEFPDLFATLRLVDFAAIFCTSAAVMVTMLFKIVRKSLSQIQDHHIFTTAQHKKSTNLLIAISVMQWFSSVPFYLYEVCHDLTGSFSGMSISEDTEDLIKISTILLAVSSSAILPIVYLIFSEQIKKELKKLCCKTVVNPATPTTMAGDKWVQPRII